MDDAGNALTNADPTDSSSTWASSHIDGTNDLDSVSCVSASPSFCVAVDDAGNALTTTDPTDPSPIWVKSSIDTGNPDSVSCASPTFCAAVDDAGNVLIYSSNSSSSSSGFRMTTASLPSGIPRVRYSATLTASGGNPPYRWSVSSGHLPKGLRLKKSTGVISGTPSKHDSGTYTFTVKVVDKKIKVKHHPATQNTATKVLSITIS